MAGAYKTPGVYIVEKNAFPNSVVEVATAVPAFIGYTEKADNKGISLFNTPWRITSLAEYLVYFGGAPNDQFDINPTAAAKTPPDPDNPNEVSDFKIEGDPYTLKRKDNKQDTERYFLFRSMLLFFQNGGGACYIVAVGAYAAPWSVEKAALAGGIVTLLKEQEPTMVLIPDAMALPQDAGIELQQGMLAHCGTVMKNRFAILDIHDGFKDKADGDPVAIFRNTLGTTVLNFGAAYYPWLHTSLVDTSELNFDTFGRAKLVELLTKAHAKDKNVAELTPLLALVGNAERDKTAKDYISDDELHKILFNVSPTYVSILTAAKRKLNLLPPSGAMAGVYTLVDNARGVWKAPANVSLAAVVSPAVNISHDEQQDLNVTTAGKSVNAIRSFIGEGVLVWGARTLDGNSLDWRYINVRRTMIMIEESLRLASKAYVFEPNVSGTWVTIKGMANNFLTSVWKRGGLAGASPEDAFSVSVGLGETMTAEDILEGILRVTILVAVSRPAEFIEITFQQQMQKS
jgi:phage tail sheath protein FI